MDEQTITKVPEPRPKNPKRVEQGKRLAAMSKAAKQAKKDQLTAEQSVSDDQSSDVTDVSFISNTGTILGTCCTLLLTYIAYSRWIQQSEVPTPTPNEAKTNEASAKTNAATSHPVVYKDLSQYDL